MTDRDNPVDPTDVLPVGQLPFSPLPLVVDPLQQIELLEDAIDWAREGLEPIAHDVEPGPVQEPGDGDGWDLIDWAQFLVVVEWLSRQELILWEAELDGPYLNPAYLFLKPIDDWLEPDRDWLRSLEGSLQPLPEERVFAPTAPFAARLGDMLGHGGAAAPGPGSTNVFVGGKPALRACDGHICTSVVPAPHVPAGFRTTNTTVLINGFPALRAGDFVDETWAGPNPIVTGCTNVHVGPVPPAVAYEVEGKLPIDGDEYPFWWEPNSRELGHFKGKVQFGIDIRGGFVRFEGTVTGMRVYAEEKDVRDIELYDFDGDGRPTVLRRTTTTRTYEGFGVFKIKGEYRPGNPKPEYEVSEPRRRETGTAGQETETVITEAD